MNIKTTSLMGLILLLLYGSVSGQNFVHGISLAATTESIALPFTSVLPLHPGAELGIHHHLKQDVRFPQRLDLYLGGFYHTEMTTGLYARGTYTWTYQPVSWGQIEASPGLGYLHTFYPGDIFELGEDGEFQAKSQMGRPHLLVEAGLGMSFFPQAKLSPFVKYRFALETPFANGIPVFPHSFLQVGLTYQLNS